MLALAIICTVLEALSLITPISDIPNEVSESIHPIATLIGGLLGVAIRSLVIVTIWVFYTHL